MDIRIKPREIRVIRDFQPSQYNKRIIYFEFQDSENLSDEEMGKLNVFLRSFRRVSVAELVPKYRSLSQAISEALGKQGNVKEIEICFKKMNPFVDKIIDLKLGNLESLKIRNNLIVSAEVFQKLKAPKLQ